jgi:hypothetical protein
MHMQNMQILEHLKSGRQITPIDALNSYGCMRLAARIHELRLEGWPIHTDMLASETNHKVHFAAYTLAADKSLWPDAPV